jgi:hypothetical protein
MGHSVLWSVRPMAEKSLKDSSQTSWLLDMGHHAPFLFCVHIAKQPQPSKRVEYINKERKETFTPYNQILTFEEQFCMSNMDFYILNWPGPNYQSMMILPFSQTLLGNQELGLYSQPCLELWFPSSCRRFWPLGLFSILVREVCLWKFRGKGKKYHRKLIS